MFKLIVAGVFLLFVVFCFWLPYRQGRKQLALVVSTILTLILIPTILSDMDYLVILPLILAGLFSIIFISYWILVNLRLRKAGKIVAIGFSILAALPFLSFALEDYWFFKSDAKELLLQNQIILQDDFKINSNHIAGLNDLHQNFELEISDKDKNIIIEQIKHSKYFEDTVAERYHLQTEMGRGIIKRVYRDYEEKDFVCRESYEHLKEGYKPDYDIITVWKKDSHLTFERIND